MYMLILHSYLIECIKKLQQKEKKIKKNNINYQPAEMGQK